MINGTPVEGCLGRMVMCLTLVGLLTLASCSIKSEAHDWYAGIRNPKTGWGCCGGQDCKVIDVSRVLETADEFVLDGKWHFKKDEAMPAQDGQYHACIWGGKERCFFFPSNV